jgi:hypothetical protein
LEFVSTEGLTIVGESIVGFEKTEGEFTVLEFIFAENLIKVGEPILGFDFDEKKGIFGKFFFIFGGAYKSVFINLFLFLFGAFSISTRSSKSLCFF